MSATYPVYVCTDCYFAHHYGATYAAVSADGTSIPWDTDTPLPAGTAGTWFAGESDTPCDRPPLALIDGEATDWTCSDHEGDDDTPCQYCGAADLESGIREFSWTWCHGCGTPLGGARYRLAVTEATS